MQPVQSPWRMGPCTTHLRRHCHLSPNTVFHMRIPTAVTPFCYQLFLGRRSLLPFRLIRLPPYAPPPPPMPPWYPIPNRPHRRFPPFYSPEIETTREDLRDPGERLIIKRMLRAPRPPTVWVRPTILPPRSTTCTDTRPLDIPPRLRPEFLST